MNNNTKAAKERRIARTKERGQYRYDNMTRDEKAAYLEKFGPAPSREKDYQAYRVWGAQAPGQVPYAPRRKTDEEIFMRRKTRFVG